jgi:hypothetical protein
MPPPQEICLQAANQQEDNEDWQYWSDLNKKRLADAEARKAKASATRAEKAVGIAKPVDKPIPEAPKKRAVAAAPVGQQNPTKSAATAQEAPRSRPVPPRPTKRPPAPEARPVPAPLDLAALGANLGANLPPEALGFAQVVYAAVTQSLRAEIEHAVQNALHAEDKARKEASAKQDRIREQRAAVVSRQAVLLKRARSVAERMDARIGRRPPTPRGLTLH